MLSRDLRLGQRVELFLDLFGSSAEAIDLALGLVAADLDDFRNRCFRRLAGCHLRLCQLLIKYGGGRFHLIDGFQNLGLVGSVSACLLQFREHHVALGKHILVGAVATEQKKAALIDDLLQHGCLRFVHRLHELRRAGLRFGQALCVQRLKKNNCRGHKAHTHQGDEGYDQLDIDRQIFERHRQLFFDTGPRINHQSANQKFSGLTFMSATGFSASQIAAKRLIFT